MRISEMPRFRDEYDDIRLKVRAPGPKAFSGLGLISLLIAIAAGVLGMILLMIAVVIGAHQEALGQPPMNENDPMAIALGVGILGSLGGTLIGLVLGVVGCFQSERNLVLPILGTVLNALILLGAIFVMCLGLAAGG